MINGIKINAGSCVIDNLRINTTTCPAGVYNNPGFKIYAGTVFWFKVGWVGKLRSCTFEISGDATGRQTPVTDPNLLHGSPFYVEWLTAGKATIEATLVVGYNKQVITTKRSFMIFEQEA